MVQCNAMRQGKNGKRRRRDASKVIYTNGDGWTEQSGGRHDHGHGCGVKRRQCIRYNVCIRVDGRGRMWSR